MPMKGSVDTPRIPFVKFRGHPGHDRPWDVLDQTPLWEYLLVGLLAGMEVVVFLHDGNNLFQTLFLVDVESLDDRSMLVPLTFSWGILVATCPMFGAISRSSLSIAFRRRRYHGLGHVVRG